MREVMERINDMVFERRRVETRKQEERRDFDGF